MRLPAFIRLAANGSATGIGLLALLAPVLHAQDSDVPVVQLDPIEVTTGRFDSAVALVPASVDVATADLLQGIAATNVADALENMGVLLRSFSGNPAQSSIDMRGFGEAGNLNVLVLVDGRRINAPDMSGVNWLDLPLASIERIEVIRGAQTALYGNNAAGGVISITTRVPDAPGGAALAEVGSWNTQIARVAAWTPTGPVSLRAETGYTRSDGYRANSGYESKSASAMVAGRTEALDWRATLGAGDTASRYPGPLGQSQFDTDSRQSEYRVFGDYYSANVRNWTATGGLDTRGDTVVLHADASANRRELSWNLGYGAHADSTLDTFTFAPRVRWGEAGTAALTVGADAEYDRLDFERFAEIERVHSIGNAQLSRWAAGGYAHGLFSVVEGLSLTATARVQWHGLDADVDEYNASPLESSETGSDTALSLGATWQPAPGLRAWVRGDRFFRYPALDEVAAFQGYALAEPFNKDLRSERGWGGELGAEWATGPVVLRLTAFAQDVEGLIAFDYHRNLNVNLSDARREGLEAGAEWRQGQFSAGAFFTLLRTTLQGCPYDGSDLYLVPRHQLTAHMTWTPIERVTLRGSVRYVGSQWQGNDLLNEYPRLPAYAVADLLLRVRLSRQWRAYAGIDNLFDRHYATLLYSGGWYPAPARGYRCGIQWDY